MREFFNNAFFLLDGYIHQLRDTDETVLYTLSVPIDSPNIGKEVWKENKLQGTVLRDFSAFQYPKLGYRQLQQGRTKNCVAAVSTIRSALRGLREDSISYAYLPVYNALGPFDPNGFDEANKARRLKEIFKPTFTPFSVGLKKLMDEEWPGFAVNEDLAVGICVSSDAGGWDIFFRGRLVGNVSSDGAINITNKILNRESIKRKLFS
jgi:hypothetical protein